MEMNLKLLVSFIVLVTSLGGMEDALTLLLPIFDQLGRLFRNFYLYSQTQIHQLWKIFKTTIKSVLLYCSETWPVSAGDLSQIKTSDHKII